MGNGCESCEAGTHEPAVCACCGEPLMPVKDGLADVEALSDEQRERFVAQLRQNLGYAINPVIADTLCGHVAAMLAEAWDEGYTSGHSNAMRRMSDEPNAPTTGNPYRIARQHGGPAMSADVGRIILCSTPEGCTCGAPASTPAGMHHCDCAVHPGWCGEATCLPCQRNGKVR